MKGLPMDEVEKLEIEISKLFQGGSTIKDLARFVLRREIEARIDELEENKWTNRDRIAELRRELEGLGEKCK